MTYSALGKFVTSSAALFAVFIFTSAVQADTVIHDKDRIVFCGDSITGQGGKAAGGGWVGLIGQGLAIAHPGWHNTLTALGGSGATVGAWLNVEKKSRDNPVYLDIKDNDVKATLDGGADVLVIMLGMNDVLAPALKDTPADLDAWAARYHDLIELLKGRAHPRVLALATITPCTENPDSPKNRVEKELNTRLVALAKQENAVVLPTHEAMVELLAEGRSYRSDFHITADFVHPSSAGHVAIAMGMLRGFGEGEAAAQLLENHEKNGKLLRPLATDLPTLAHILTEQPASPDESLRHFTIHYQWTPGASGEAPSVSAAVPAGWQVTPASLTGTSGDFQVSGPTDRLVNTVTLNGSAGDVKKQDDINIPAGWRVAAGGGKGLGWTNNSDYDPTVDHLPIDQDLLQDRAFLKPAAFPTGDTPEWQYYRASINFTGYDAPGSIDMAAVEFFKFHDLAYGARWIYSSKDRPVDVNLGTRAFAGNFGEAVLLNGDTLYQGKLFAVPGRKVTAEGKLHRGWNRLVFRSTYVAWQWQFSIDLAGKPGDDLADLRYATAPPVPGKAD